MTSQETWTASDDWYVTLEIAASRMLKEGPAEPRKAHPVTCLCMYCVIVTKSCGDPRCDDLTHIDIKWRNDG